MVILMFLVFGLVVGLLARAIMPGRQTMGLAMTTVLGVVGSFAGGLLASLTTGSRITDFNTSGLVGSVLGALLVLLVAGGLFGRSRA